jgi:3-methyladenine DNA glycosylase AlkD
MARFGIAPEKALGISIPLLRAIAHEIGVDHHLARGLWDSGIHEARILAGMIADPARMTGRDMDRWAADFDSWDLCDQSCLNLFVRTEQAFKKSTEWAAREEEYVKRAGFALMACLAVHRKDLPDRDFMRLLRVIRRQADDDRNFVRKAVSWALRQIGKRNEHLRREALACARALQNGGSPAARWVASDATRELTGERVLARMRRAK